MTNRRQLPNTQVYRLGASSNGDPRRVTDAVMIERRSLGGSITLSYWESVGRGESEVTVTIPFGAFGTLRRFLTAADKERRSFMRKYRRSQRKPTKD
ncbi:hypothetical protein DLREEDagr8_29680 [Dongia sp. agr-C8]